MAERLIETSDQRKAAIHDIMLLDLPYRITISPKKTRSEGQNARYWSWLQFHIDEVSRAVQAVTDYTGYTPLEVRAMIAKELTPEQALILYSLKKEAVHDALKLICGIPTSTRLGTKKFMEYEAIMENQMAEVLGEVNNFAADCR